MLVLKGVVEKGPRIGTALGFPTANIPLADTSVSGIYAARVIVKKDEAPYVAAVFADPKRKILEAHILDFSDDLYGQEVEVELHKKLRESKTFSDDMALRAAIADDIVAVREFFKR